MERWNTAFDVLRRYRREHPGEWPFLGYATKDGFHLGVWCFNQRSRKREEKLSRNRTRELNAIGFPWKGVRLNEIWEKSFEALRRFHSRHGHCRPSWTSAGSAARLAMWCHLQRKRRRVGRLSKQRVKKLEALGFEWQPVLDYWERGLWMLAAYRRKHPGSLAKSDRRSPERIQIGKLVRGTA